MTHLSTTHPSKASSPKETTSKLTLRFNIVSFMHICFLVLLVLFVLFKFQATNTQCIDLIIIKFIVFSLSFLILHSLPQLTNEYWTGGYVELAQFSKSHVRSSITQSSLICCFNLMFLVWLLDFAVFSSFKVFFNRFNFVNFISIDVVYCIFSFIVDFVFIIRNFVFIFKLSQHIKTNPSPDALTIAASSYSDFSTKKIGTDTSSLVIQHLIHQLNLSERRNQQSTALQQTSSVVVNNSTIKSLERERDSLKAMTLQLQDKNAKLMRRIGEFVQDGAIKFD
ncbi:hypothetical protein RCL1_004867 [Eukaryota sp. TZLM3-RCL]